MGGIEPLLRLRPLGLGELLDDVFRVYRRHFWLLFGISLLLSLPNLALQLVSGSADALGFFLGAIPDLANPNALAARQPPAPPNLVLSLLGDLVVIVLVPFTVGAVTKAAIDAAQGSPVTIRSALGGVAGRYWGLMGLTLLFVVLSLLPIVRVKSTATFSAKVPSCRSDSSDRRGSRVSSPPPASGSPITECTMTSWPSGSRPAASQPSTMGSRSADMPTPRSVHTS